MRKVPEISTKAHQNTMVFHCHVRAVRSLVQLSYSHMHAIGWNAMNVPRRAPTRETRSSKTGIPLAMTYATIVTVKVHPSQTDQWIGEFEVRCLLPRRRRTKMYLLGTCTCQLWKTLM